MEFYILIGFNGINLMALLIGLFKIGKWVGEKNKQVEHNTNDIKNLPCIKKPDEYFKK